jgi:hypothetical protein
VVVGCNGEGTSHHPFSPFEEDNAIAKKIRTWAIYGLRITLGDAMTKDDIIESPTGLSPETSEVCLNSL